MIISNAPFRLVATLLVRNEEDIVGANIEHHVEHGVSHFIVTDNASTDRTREILGKYPEVVEVIDEPCLEHRQSEWVTRMARLACKLDPHWIVHLDADELWCGLTQLRLAAKPAVASTKMFLHPPRLVRFDLHRLRYYLDFEDAGLPGESKVMHRPDPEIVIVHGNHGCNRDTEFTKAVWRHHYPVRCWEQFLRKTVDGHEALLRRNAPCERWGKWYAHYQNGTLCNLYDRICDHWESMVHSPSSDDLIPLLEFWSTPEVIRYFKETKRLPKIGQWPKDLYEEQSISD